jgi:hypothetical protein
MEDGRVAVAGKRPAAGEQLVGTMPKEKMSLRASSGRPAACSGDI